MTSAAPAHAAAAGNDGTGGDALSAMRPAMNTAAAVGQPTNAAGAGSILATGTSYLSGAAATIGRIDDGIAKRTRALAGLAANGASVEALKAAGDQIDMLQRLRDRIQLSIERVSDIMAGKDRDDVGGPDGDDAADGRRRDEERLAADSARRRAEEHAQLEQRLQVLGASAGASLVGSPADVVAATYRAGSSGGA